MKTILKIVLLCLLGIVSLSLANAGAESETRYLAFQIFTRFTPDPNDAQALSSGMREPLVPGTAALRNYVEDIKQRIGTVGDPQTRLAVMLGPLCFDQSNIEIAQFVERAFDLALEANMAVGFHVDDSMFWRSRKDLWSDPQNVEALDWDGTPNTSRRLDWSKKPTSAPPQMCFNSQAVQREVRQRSAVIGKAIQAGVNRLQQLKRPELFAGVIAGWETMIGQDFKTGKYLGYRALRNRGFTREHPPQDMNVELEKVVQEFIELWTTGLTDAGVAPQKIYSHTAFLSRRAFTGDDKSITYMKRQGEITYSQHNHFAPPSVAFGKHHRPGFSTYPQSGLFEDIYELVEKHQQVGWSSSEGTNMQPGTGPGQTGMNMETYLAKMFNHGATLVNLFSWGIGGEAMKNMSYRVCTESDEALQAYRKFLKGEPLIEGMTVASLHERLPPKIQKIQRELPAWLQKTGNKEALALMKKMHGQMQAKDWLEVEKTADAILKMMDGSAPASASPGNASTAAPAESAEAAPQRVAAKIRTDPTDHFSVWISKMDGSARKLILSDPKRQLSHTRVSPDLKWVVFTTYNNPGKDGFAKEDNNYLNAEIRLFKLGGTELKTIAGPVPGEVNANASFSSDGKRIIFVSTRSGKGAYLYWYDLETGLTTQVPTPPALHQMADPHEVQDKIIFTAHPGDNGGLQGVWMMNRDGSEARQISFPKKSPNAPAESVGQGDYDPRLSPDGSRVSILRNVGGAFHIVLLDIATGKETDLTEPLFPERKQTAEGVAAWSSDGKWLIFRHIALPREGPRGVGIYIMSPDGSGRKKVLLAKGEFPHVQPEFFPEGSGPETRVIYQTEKNPLFQF
ncbi:MAG: hypothetical protein WCO56_04775 [Verrucomicrobiota bacterium]